MRIRFLCAVLALTAILQLTGCCCWRECRWRRRCCATPCCQPAACDCGYSPIDPRPAVLRPEAGLENTAYQNAAR